MVKEGYGTLLGKARRRRDFGLTHHRKTAVGTADGEPEDDRHGPHSLNRQGKSPKQRRFGTGFGCWRRNTRTLGLVQLAYDRRQGFQLPEAREDLIDPGAVGGIVAQIR